MKSRIYILSILIFLAIVSGVLAVSQNYYAVTTVYFNIPYDASFSIAMPTGYTVPTTITGTNYQFATATSLISFNFTDIPSRVEPFAQGTSAYAQSGTAKPIFMYTSLGNTNIKIYINLTQTPSGIQVEVNGACDGAGCTKNAALPLNLTGNSETRIVDSLSTGARFNCTLYGYADSNAQPGQSNGIPMYHHSTIA